MFFSQINLQLKREKYSAAKMFVTPLHFCIHLTELWSDKVLNLDKECNNVKILKFHIYLLSNIIYLFQKFYVNL